MGYSDFRKGFKQKRPVATATGGSASGLQTTTIELNKDNLTAEHVLNITATRDFSVAPTAGDVRKAIKSIELLVTGGPGNGTRISLSGYQAFDLARFTESQPSPAYTLGTPSSSVNFALELHHVLHGARNDLQTAINTGLYSSLALVIQWNNTTDAATVFTGGTASGDFTYAVDVECCDYPVIPAEQNAAQIATMQQKAECFNKTITGAGSQDDVILRSGNNKTRFLMIHAFNGSNVLSNSIVDQIELQVGNWIYKTTFKKAQHGNINDRGVNLTGLAVLDFGDDPMGWLPLNDVKDARIKWTALAAGRIEVAQVYMTGL